MRATHASLLIRCDEYTRSGTTAQERTQFHPPICGAQEWTLEPSSHLLAWQIIPTQCSHRRRLPLERMNARLYEVQAVSHLSSVVNPEKLNWL